MPIHDNRTKYKYQSKRTNLFLLRVWCDDPNPHLDENDNENGHMAMDGDKDKGERSDRKWHGRLQSTVSGEAHSFEGRGALIEVLEKMLYKNWPKHNEPPGKLCFEDNTLQDGNDVNEAIQ